MTPACACTRTRGGWRADPVTVWCRRAVTLLAAASASAWLVLAGLHATHSIILLVH